MGCKCANSAEGEEEINKKAVEDGTDKNTPNDFNNDFNKNENLLGFNNQENINQESNSNQNNLQSKVPYDNDENIPFNAQNELAPNLRYTD